MEFMLLQQVQHQELAWYDTNYSVLFFLEHFHATDEQKKYMESKGKYQDFECKYSVISSSKAADQSLILHCAANR